MSAVPPAIADVGATTQRLVQNPKFDPLHAGFGTEEYFVWSRFDGATTLKDLILMTGLPVDRAIAIVQQLWKLGAIVAPGGPPQAAAPPRPAPAPAPLVSRTATAPVPPVARTTTMSTPRTTTSDSVRAKRPSAPAGNAPVPELADPTAEELVALAEPTTSVTEPERRRILAGLRLVAAGDPWALLGVARGADKKQLKRAFFERSKLFHPDRYFGKDLGAWKGRLHAIFEAITRAHDDLTGNTAARSKRASSGGGGAPEATAPQTPAEYAAELFDRACVAEVSGDAAQALKLFAAAVKLDGQARYLRRAAVCAMTAGELRAAEDYAKKAVVLEGSDPSTARILGKVLRALGKLESAEEVLVMALAMKSENDTLMKELAADLRAVRADMARG